jgi:hypothetical protein
VDAWCAPQRVLPAHPANQLACFDRHARTTATAMTGLPRPEEAEASSVPTDDRLGFHDNQRGTPVPPSYRQPCPQEPVRRGQLRSFHRPLHNGELMAQSQHLQLKVCTAAKTIPQCSSNGQHSAGNVARKPRRISPQCINQIRICENHSRGTVTLRP